MKVMCSYVTECYLQGQEVISASQLRQSHQLQTAFFQLLNRFVHARTQASIHSHTRSPIPDAYLTSSNSILNLQRATKTKNRAFFRSFYSIVIYIKIQLSEAASFPHRWPHPQRLSRYLLEMSSRNKWCSCKYYAIL